MDKAAGLSSVEARDRLSRYGENRLAEKPARSKWLLYHGWATGHEPGCGAHPRRHHGRAATSARCTHSHGVATGAIVSLRPEMAVGTLALFLHARPQGETHALTLAFTTFVLFQFFNIFNARAEHGSAFNGHFFHNRWLWLSLAAVLLLQILVVHWGPAQAVFHTTDLSLHDWALSVAIASSVLLFDEGRKLAWRLLKP